MDNKKSKLASSDNFFKEVRGLIVTARVAAGHSVNLIQVYTNFEIGKRIVEQEQRGENRAEYGKQLLKVLSEELTKEFGKGFSRTNLAHMRNFFMTYQDRLSIVQPMTGQFKNIVDSQTSPEQSKSSNSPNFKLSWTHYVLLLSIQNPDERTFYEIEAADQNWTIRELKRQFNSGLYERLALSRDKENIKKLAQEGQVVTDPRDIFKEPYVLEFLGLDDNQQYSESDLETAIIDQIEKFLLELGKGFLFESRQKRFTYGEEHYFVDLVFYNRLLRCYVLIDLKIGKLSHQDLGQMQMYVNYFDQKVKLENENPTIGILLCKIKNEAMVKITLPKDANIHAHEYQLYLPSKNELQEKLLEWTAQAR